MDTCTVLLLFLVFLCTCAADICSPSSCDDEEPAVRFPFRLKDRRPKQCGYPGFDLSCNNLNRTILNLPFSGDFVVTKIDYKLQRLYVNDPEFCLMRRILDLDLKWSRFRGVFLEDYTFYNCSSDWPSNCLFGKNYSVVTTTSGNPLSRRLTQLCRYISAVQVPVQSEYSSMDLNMDLLLTWSGAPRCGPCEGKGGTCRFTSYTTLGIECSDLPKSGLPRSAKYGIIIGAGIPALVCIVGLLCYIGNKIPGFVVGRRQVNLEFSAPTIEPHVVGDGLDGRTIESYPKIILGDSGRLPAGDDGTCPICLAEYQPKETLRTLPDCSHYFHANCIDSWLKMNATCPLCRKTSDSSSLATPGSSMSLSSSSTSINS